VSQLSDFLTASYEQGGLTSLLALEGLFVLMLHHNLEYPRFYASLYKLLTPQVSSHHVVPMQIPRVKAILLSLFYLGACRCSTPAIGRSSSGCSASASCLHWSPQPWWRHS
jgi:hypothetical protein